MPFVVDCSITMAWVFPDEANETTNALRESLVSDMAVVPELWPLEVGNVLVVATRRGRIHARDWNRIRSDLALLPIELDVQRPRTGSGRRSCRSHSSTDYLPMTPLTLSSRYG